MPWWTVAFNQQGSYCRPFTPTHLGLCSCKSTPSSNNSTTPGWVWTVKFSCALTQNQRPILDRGLRILFTVNIPLSWFGEPDYQASLLYDRLMSSDLEEPLGAYLLLLRMDETCDQCATRADFCSHQPTSNIGFGSAGSCSRTDGQRMANSCQQRTVRSQNLIPLFNILGGHITFSFWPSSTHPDRIWWVSKHWRFLVLIWPYPPQWMQTVWQRVPRNMRKSVLTVLHSCWVPP